jgi:hypothetical protein
VSTEMSNLTQQAIEALNRSAAHRQDSDKGSTETQASANPVVPGLPILRMPCASPDLAEKFAAWVRKQWVDVNGVEGREVLIPTDNPGFAYVLAEAAVLEECANDDEAAAAASAFESEVASR